MVAMAKRNRLHLRNILFGVIGRLADFVENIAQEADKNDAAIDAEAGNGVRARMEDLHDSLVKPLSFLRLARGAFRKWKLPAGSARTGRTMPRIVRACRREPPSPNV